MLSGREEAIAIDRRTLLCAAGLAVLPAAPVLAQPAVPPTPPGPDERRTAARQRLLEGLQRGRLPLALEDGRPSGAGWDFLLGEAAAARFTLFGEVHGVVETERLAAALFEALIPAGYGALALELAPTVARDMAAAAGRGGIAGLRRFMAEAGVAGGLYGWRQGMEFFVRSAAAARGIWGLDRDLFNDRYLIAKLAPRVPASARAAFERLQAASTESWAALARSPDPNPDNMFSLSADPALAAAVRAAWPRPDPESGLILETLEESLVIGSLSHTRLYQYLERRAALHRSNLLRNLREARAPGPVPRVMVKFGHNHLIRGANYFNIFDLGALAPELAALEGGRSFHLLVLPGPGSSLAVPGRDFAPTPVASDAYDELRAGENRLDRALAGTAATGHEVIDLRPLRPLAARGAEALNPDLVRTIHGYDAALIWHRAHAETGWD
ncbi:MAG TPA: hypothetical protein VEC11_13580 [Allosphingosinicella sp.]|nr:hypothetical protein [Allosphingosinicella sp.]